MERLFLQNPDLHLLPDDKNCVRPLQTHCNFVLPHMQFFDCQAFEFYEYDILFFAEYFSASYQIHENELHSVLSR